MKKFESTYALQLTSLSNNQYYEQKLLNNQTFYTKKPRH